MAKCPSCGGELHPQENGLWKCAECGKLFRMKQKTPPESDMNAGAPQAQTPPASERNVTEPPVQTEPSAPADEAQTAEIEELKRRLAAMEKQQTEKTAGRGGAAAGAAAAKFAPVIEFLKKYGLKVVLPVALLVVAFVTLCACFMGLRGIYVNVNDPNEFISFTATDYEWYDMDALGVSSKESGTWKRTGNTLEMKAKDEIFGEITADVALKDFSWNSFTMSILGVETTYKRISLICYKDNISKATVTFDLNGGSGNAESRKMKIGSTLGGAPQDPERLGATFRGWNTSPDGNGDWLSTAERVWEDITYYAVWNIQWDMEHTSDGGLQLNGFADGSSVPSVLVIPDGVTSIGRSAFADHTGLTSVIIPDSVTSIGDYAFSDCTGLTSVSIGNAVTRIGDSAFDGCIGLTSITIPDSVTSLGLYAFRGCTNIATATMPTVAINYIPQDSLQKVVLTSGERIEADAFRNCSSLTSVSIPDSVTGIGDNAFSGCDNLKYNEYDNAYYLGNEINPYVVLAKAKDTAITSCIINERTKCIASPAFSDCRVLTSITIPNSVTSIGSYAFSDCTGLTSITIPDSVTSIGSHAFDGCIGLTSITIPDSVISIGSRAFQLCRLTSITIGSGVTNIVSGAFYGCSRVTSIIVAEDNPVYYSKENCIIETATKTLVVGNATGVIPSDGSVTSIGDEAFSGYRGLTAVVIPDGVTSIGHQAFVSCWDLTSVTIPDSMTSISNTAFFQCPELKYNYYDNAQYLGNESNPYVALIRMTDTRSTSCIIHDQTKIISKAAFLDCDSLKTITIPDKVTAIGSVAFRGCSSLTSVIIGDAVTDIGSSAFMWCRSLTSIVIPDSVTNIGYQAFYDSSALTSFTFEGTVDEWNAVIKEAYWESGAAFTEVVCSDGTVSV